MLETVDFSLEALPKDEYKLRRDQLTDRLVVLQQQARAQGVGLVVLFEGWDGAGKGSRISDLLYHLDARATSVHVTENLDVKAARTFAGASYGVTGFYPIMQEFWQSLGMRGTTTFYDRGWYTAAVQHMLYAEYGSLTMAQAEKAKGERKAVAAAMAQQADAVTIVGGGDSASAVEQTGLAHQLSHISTGGGASLEFLEGLVLPGIACLADKEQAGGNADS